MAVQLTKDALRAIYPKARPGAIDAFMAKLPILQRAGWLETRTRLSYALAQMGHESGGLTIVAENLNYTARRMTQVWPSRFKTVEAALPFANNPMKLANNVYGGRMGNRPNTNDGWDYRGRGFIQITGRDGYVNVGKRCGLALDQSPHMAEDVGYQPEVVTGFWAWKALNPVCDTGDFLRCTKLINGGTNGLADRQAWLARIKPVVDGLAGGPSTPKPPPYVIDAATTKERTTRNAGVASGATGGLVEGAKGATEQPTKPAPLMSPMLTWSLIGVGVAVVIVTTILIARKTAAIAANWR